MKSFDVYKHPTRGYEAVKRGFSWPAFFFNWLWAFVKRLWVKGLLMVVVIVIASIMEGAFEQAGTFDAVIGIVLINLALFVWIIGVGVKANEWRRNDLVKRGFDHVQDTEARTRSAAIASLGKRSTAD